MTAPAPRRALQLWLEHLQVSRGLSANTVASYGRDGRDFLGNAASLPTDRTAVEAWLTRRQDQSPRSNARRLSALRQFYAYARQKGWVEADPTADLATPKQPQPLPKALSESQMQALLQAPLGDSHTEVRLRLILTLLYVCGLRVSELASLTLHDVQQAEGPWLRVTGKGSKTRAVPLGPVVQEVLQAYLAHARSRLKGASGPWLLPGPGGKRPLTRVRLFQVVKEAGARVGVAVAPHHLRHTFATHLLNHQADLRAVQLMLGHASLNTTQIYTRLTTQRLKDTLETHHPLAQTGRRFGKRGRA
ncbi:MAG: tyrosine recombinase [Alphaproteobacteria bacterium]|nr:tyrosine recombinase [Alphaproteobacteria bacterium]